MTRIDYEVSGSRHRLVLNGHTGYAESGRDIVCAAVSSHVFTLIRALHRYDCEIISEGELNENGEVTVEAIVYDGVLSGIFNAIADGLALLSENYPQYVAVCY